jgi:hypothetical protein
MSAPSILAASTLSIIDVLDDDQLLGAALQHSETFGAWRVFLRALFGLPINPDDMPLFTACTGRTIAPTKRASEGYAIVSRRGRKTLMLSSTAAYLAAFQDWRGMLGPGERGVIHLIAADRRQARIAFRYVLAFLKASPLLARMIERETSEEIDLSNGVTVQISTASYRTTRGYSIIATLLDEAAFYAVDGSAEPDRDIVAALLPGMATTGGILLVASSPHRKSGIIWDARRKFWGVNDSSVLVWQADSRTMNPMISQEIVDAAIERDAASAQSEWLGQFRDDLTDFIDRAAVEACVEAGVRERPPVAGVRYFSFTDPSGGSNDAMTTAIGHMESDVVVVDAIREVPAPFDPESVVAEFVELFRRYGIKETVGDAYASQWCATAFDRHGITYCHSELNRSQLYLTTLPLINSKTVRLLDHPRAVNQFCSLERRTTRGGRDTVDHRPNASDDLCNAIAGLCATVSFGRRRGEVSVGIIQSDGRVVPYRDPSERVSALKGGAHQIATAGWKKWDGKRFV